jgi:hypothetical protein
MLLSELQKEHDGRERVEQDQKATIEALQAQVSALQKAQET